MLSNLNDDCLLEIFELLPLKDQVELTDVCQRFQYLVVNYIWSRKYTDLHTQMWCLKPLNIRQYKKFFQKNKENLLKLKIVDDNNFVYVYNSNRLHERPGNTFYFGLKMSNLKELNCPNAWVYDGYIKVLSKNCPNLEILCFGNSLVSGAYINEMKHLKMIKFGNRVIQMPLSDHLSMYEYEETACHLFPQ